MHQILLMGCGHMGGAMLQGWRDNVTQDIHFTVIDRHLSLGDAANITLFPSLDVAASSLPTPDMVILAVKPNAVAEVLPNLVALGRVDTVFLSVAAGLSRAWLQKHIAANSPNRVAPQAIPVIRTMPNMPTAIGRGVTALIASDSVPQNMVALAETMLGAIGTVVRLTDEGDIDAVTAISGSGPAYIFLLREALEEAAKSMGLDAEMAKTLARETILGTALMMQDNPLSASELRGNIAIAGGTTEAALKILMADDAFISLMKKAVLAARNRSQVMSP